MNAFVVLVIRSDYFDTGVFVAACEDYFEAKEYATQVIREMYEDELKEYGVVDLDYARLKELESDVEWQEKIGLMDYAVNFFLIADYLPAVGEPIY